MVGYAIRSHQFSNNIYESYQWFVQATFRILCYHLYWWNLDPEKDFGKIPRLCMCHYLSIRYWEDTCEMSEILVSVNCCSQPLMCILWKYWNRSIQYRISFRFSILCSSIKHKCFFRWLNYIISCYLVYEGDNGL